MKIALDFKAQDLRGSLKGLALESKATVAMREALVELHKEVRAQVAERYRGRRPEASISIQQTGSSLTGTLTYVHRPTNLAEAVVAHRWGNIEPFPKTRAGRIALVQVLRQGGEKIAFGKHGFGGFVPRNLERSSKAYMLERTSKAKYPVKQVWMLSEAQKAGLVLNRMNKIRPLRNEFVNKFARAYGILN